jgi:hypothetical protein
MRKLLLPVLFGLTLLAGCSSEPAKPAVEQKAEPKAAELVTGRTAMQKLYVAAHGWARDAQPFRLESQITTDGNGHGGKSAIWRASFASPAQRGVKPYFWSGSASPDAPSRGITPGNEDNYNPSNASTQVFDIAFLKTDSDKGFDVAQQHGGEKLLDKTPDQPVIYLLDWNRAENRLEWHVAYGTSRDTAKLTVTINASTGEFVRVEK